MTLLEWTADGETRGQASNGAGRGLVNVQKRGKACRYKTREKRLVICGSGRYAYFIGRGSIEIT